jgi:predicted esterase
MICSALCLFFIGSTDFIPQNSLSKLSSFRGLDQLERHLAETARMTGVNTGRILIFGFSAGAHFAHRFALWKPERVKAFVAYSAAWWSPPTEELRDVPALILCGEADSRFEATREFMEQAMALDLPWIWRSYKNVGHELTPQVRDLAEAFLARYADGAPEEAFAGDVQTFQFLPASRKAEIPEALRVNLPSRAIAETWSKE